ncbi:hypothetical protein OSB04_013351 [Centaurea solstitialis]|uniref:TIR domain-containing protein n=1 Tax=Centaurea solstitialis TaxID=347529 RepID=A0AA38WFE9_9ASTR|nr:hypothetical protein OSB04_013351 [Centaurea solstitialis]
MVALSEISTTYDHDVFLSFRGADTRYGFTNHLHKALLDAAIDTFLDDVEIQIGEDLKPELETAIKASRASIIVLSKDYASSAWCLDELVLILEQRKTSKHIVIPIFYHVKPTDVRKQQSSFRDSMAKHKQKMEAEPNEKIRSKWAQKIKQWEKALTEVADMKGEEANGRLETILIERIVKEVNFRLEQYKRRKIPHLIGMESSVRTITTFLKDASSHTTEILTIWGMAGIGKTYLANYIFELHYQDFERSSFLEDVGRRCKQPNGLLDLQKQLLKDIRDIAWMDIHDAKAGTCKIEKLLHRKKTLLVLDGIDHFEQLDVLVGTIGYHTGSKIIVTTKEASLTEKCRLFETEVPPNHEKHLLKGLNQEESLELLSWHSSKGNNLKEIYEKLAKKVVKYCGGHTLALKVLGSSLLGEDVAAWEDTIELLKKETNPTIQHVLQISFDSLPSNNDKELFKHIACFFIGKDREFVEAILRECGMRTAFGFSKLIDRCLLEVGPGNELMMHQLLQEMGRDLVRQESPKKPWKRSRLWHHEESYDVLKQEKVLRSLKFLILNCCHELVSVCHLDGFPLLERLILSGCVSLVAVCKSIGNCNRLSYLDVSGCNKLKRLPKSIRKLKNLATLKLDGCLNLYEFPMEMKDIESRHVLEPNNVTIESQVPSSVIVDPRSLKSFAISLPSSLVRLLLRNNNLSNESFPVDFGSLSMLEELYLDGNPIDSLPDCVRSLSRLELLSLEKCHRLRTVLCAPNTLKRLPIVGCDSLEKITFHPQMSKHPIIDYEDTTPLTEIEGLFKMQAIAETEEETLRSLGWINIQHVEDQKLPMMSYYQSSKGKVPPRVLPIQMLYESGILSTFFQGNAPPLWITHISCMSVLHFMLPSSGQSHRIRGLNLCVVTSKSSTETLCYPMIKLRNSTKGYMWVYSPRRCCVIPEGSEEGIVWLSHWMFGNDEFEVGDEVVVQGIYIGGDITACGASVVYDDGHEKGDPLACYTSWNHITDDHKDRQGGSFYYFFTSH